MRHNLMQFFEYSHLPEHLKKISQPFSSLAILMHGLLPDNEERQMALRKLLEAKDCAVRAALYKVPENNIHKCDTPPPSPTPELPMRKPRF